MITVFSYFLQSEQIQANITGAVGGFLPGSEQFVKDNIEGILNIRSALGLFSLVGLLWSGSAMMGALDRAINRAWDIHNDRPIYIGKPRHILMVISAGLMFATSMSSAAVVRTAQELPGLDLPVIGFVIDNMGHIILQGVSFTLMLVIFLMNVQGNSQHEDLLEIHLAGRPRGRYPLRDVQESVHPLPRTVRVLPERVWFARARHSSAVMGIRQQFPSF